MSHLAIDYGTKKIGLATSFNGIALPLQIVATKDIFKILPWIIADRKISTIVVGIANHMDGRVSDQTLRTREFVRKLTSIVPKHISIIEWDERLTSFEAKSSLEYAGQSGIHDPIDDMAASILLQSYLDSITD